MDIRFRFAVIGFLAMIAAVIWLFPTWYPMLDRDSVPNPFPGLEDSAWEAFLSLPADQQAAYRALRDGNEKEDIEGRPTAALGLVRAKLLGSESQAPEAENTFEAPENIPLLKDGVFTQIDAVRWAYGRIAIYGLAGQRILRFNPLVGEVTETPFETVPAPDLRIIFTRNPDPLDEAGVGVDYIDIGPIKAITGNQTYVADGTSGNPYNGLLSVDFSQYPVLALYSPSLDLVISTATLR